MSAATLDELEAMLVVARAAAVVVMQIRNGGDLGLEQKGPDDPVTRADKLANALLVGELGRLFPEHGIVAEESAQSVDELAAQVARPRVFFIDPVDGTREFAAGLPEFAVMVGLAVDGAAAAGVLVLPAEGVLLAGRVGGEAFLERDAAPGVREPLRLTSLDSPSSARVVVSRSHPAAELAAILERLGNPTQIRCGSVGVKIARVAMGEADLYVHPGRGAKTWDGCAPEAVIRAAGGDFTDALGTRIDYATTHIALARGMCASNGRLHAAATAAARAVLGAPSP